MSINQDDEVLYECNTNITRRNWLASSVGMAVGVYATGLQAADKIPTHTVKVINQYPHDSRAFTQGLCFDAKGNFYEGTGQYGQSSLRQVELTSGKVLKRTNLPKAFFGEGIAIRGDELVQLTWKKRTAIYYDLKTFSRTGVKRYKGEGWGLTWDGTYYIKSNGSDRIEFRDPDTFTVVRSIPVRAGYRQVKDLNELEYINGEIWANLWYQDYIARISPETGQVLGWIDLTRVWPQNVRRDREKVLNGIAQNPVDQKIYVTGKNWPALYEIEIVGS